MIDRPDRFNSNFHAIKNGVPFFVFNSLDATGRIPTDSSLSLRSVEIAGHPIFDHVGNMGESTLVTSVAVLGSYQVAKRLNGKNRERVMLGAAGVTVGGVAAVNVAYESGADVKVQTIKPADSGFDGYDAFYGSLASVTMAATLATSAIKLWRQRK